MHQTPSSAIHAPARAFRPQWSRPARDLSGLFAAGDRVASAGGQGPLCEIIHISQKKAWIRQLDKGGQSIVPLEELRFIDASEGGPTLM